ncbi:MAG: AAA family ATPase [Planctomycetota bacterium]|nr:AAA family ATPase [Planctomycetota bacterium]
MSQEIQLRTSENLPDIADPLSVYDRHGEQPSQVFRKLHRLLRNRYKWAIALSLLGLALGGFGGFKLAKRTYISSGMIQIKPALSPVISPNAPEIQLMPLFESFVQGQASFLRSQRVINMAMNSDSWRVLGRPIDEDGIDDFQKNLEVLAPKGEMIYVTFTDPDPRATTAAVKSVLEAYRRQYVEKDAAEEANKQNTVENLRRDLSAQLKDKREQIKLIADKYGTKELRSIHEAKLQNVNRLESALAEIDFQLDALKARGADGKENKDEQGLTVAEIGLRDAGMRQLLHEKEIIEAEAVKTKNLGEKHPKVIELSTLLTAKKEAIRRYAEDFRDAMKNSVGIGGSQMAGVSVDELKRRKEAYTTSAEKADGQAKAVGRDMLDIDRFRNEEEQIIPELERVRKRLAELSIEATQGRIRIISDGDRPMPAKDNRIIRAAAGGIAGGGFGFGIILLIALLDRRLRSADDARSSVGKLALLGVLPSLPDDLADPEQAAIAAHCVHQIRTLLQISAPVPGSRVFVITSPAAGTGKTSLALALGVSFAATNSRTLLIDCDIVGGGLTARVDTIIRRKIGQILKREGLITQQQLDMAMKVAATSHRRLGEILVDLGFLTEADVARGLTLQEEAPIGMLDAMNGENIDDCVADTGIRGLSILPLGAAMPADAGRLSPNAVRKLIDEARKRYDTVLVDTGPIPGSLEASVVAAAADGVVLVVSRGEHRPPAERSLQHLHDIGAVVAGMVFNRAESRDMELTTTTNRLSSFDRGVGRGSVRVADVVQSGEPQKLGPIAFAVTGRTPSGKNGSRPHP